MSGRRISPTQDRAVFLVNARMRAGVMDAHHPLGVKPIAPAAADHQGSLPGQGLWSPARGLICRALTRGMTAADWAIWTVLPGRRRGRCSRGRAGRAGPAAAGDLGRWQGRGDAPAGAPPSSQGPGAAGADPRETSRDRGEGHKRMAETGCVFDVAVPDGPARSPEQVMRPDPGAGKQAPRAENRWYACDIATGRDVTVGKTARKRSSRSSRKTRARDAGGCGSPVRGLDSSMSGVTPLGRHCLAGGIPGAREPGGP
jgi:hypothetical protein